MPDPISQASLKTFLLTVKEIIASPATVDRLLTLIAKNEEVVEKYRLEVAELAHEREALRRARAETDDHIAQAKIQWMAEERARREAIAKAEAKANATHQPMARRTPAPEPEQHQTA
jgi:hypothetical protein